MVSTRMARIPGATSIRVAALAGVVFFVLILVNGSALSGAPSATDPGREIVDYVSRHQSRLQLSAALLGLSMAASLVWLSGLFRTLRRAEGGSPGLAVIAFAGGVLAAASTVTGALIEGTIATRIDDLGPPGARVWWTMYLSSFGVTLIGLLLVIGATAVVCVETHLFAPWFATASTVLALASVAGAFAIGYTTSAIQIVAGIAIVLDTVWILVVSLFLWRDPALALP